MALLRIVKMDFIPVEVHSFDELFEEIHHEITHCITFISKVCQESFLIA